MHKSVRVLILALIASMWLLINVQSAAQTAAVLVAPSSLAVSPGDEFAVQVQVRDVEDLYGLDIRLTFDPALLQAEELVAGDVLPPAVFEAERTLDNDAGQVTYVVTFMPPSSPFTGSGVLFTLTFRALSPGSSELDLDALLANTSAQSIPVSVSGGSVLIGGTTATASPTLQPGPHRVFLPLVLRQHFVSGPTATASATPSATLLPTTTPTVTPSLTPLVTTTGTVTALPTPSATTTPTEMPSLTPSSTATGTVLPSLTPSPTTTTTVTLSPTPSATPVVTPSPGPHYQQLVANPSFETEEAWEILQTVYPAGYSLSRARKGLRSMRLGIIGPYPQPVYSSVQQTVEIPAAAAEAMLSFYYFPVSSSVDADYLYLVLYRASDNVRLRTMRWMDRHQSWNLQSLDLLEHAGERIRLQIGLYNDGQGVTTVYVDDVELWVRVTDQ